MNLSSDDRTINLKTAKSMPSHAMQGTRLVQAYGMRLD
ncbi:hypothetical protein Pan258_30950 [Symmachiella dynata]|nr:hypothetical protein Pan258_30950 [Symmachiella dynata]